MAGVSRREFLGKAGVGSAAAGFLLANGVTVRANPLGLPIGSQAYPHRARIAAGDFAGLLKDMKTIGIEVVELCNPTYADFKILANGKETRKILDDSGIKCLSAHFQMAALRADHPAAPCRVHAGRATGRHRRSSRPPGPSRPFGSCVPARSGCAGSPLQGPGGP